jgi:hypothetical protein
LADLILYYYSTLLFMESEFKKRTDLLTDMHVRRMITAVSQLQVIVTFVLIL